MDNRVASPMIAILTNVKGRNPDTVQFIETAVQQENAVTSPVQKRHPPAPRYSYTTSLEREPVLSVASNYVPESQYGHSRRDGYVS